MYIRNDSGGRFRWARPSGGCSLTRLRWSECFAVAGEDGVGGGKCLEAGVPVGGVCLVAFRE